VGGDVGREKALRGSESGDSGGDRDEDTAVHECNDEEDVDANADITEAQNLRQYQQQQRLRTRQPKSTLGRGESLDAP
jgi:hypothetical protein